MLSICRLWVEFMALNQDLKFCMRTAGQTEGRTARRLDGWTAKRVGENNTTGGPNSSADTELSWSVGAMYGNKVYPLN